MIFDKLWQLIKENRDYYDTIIDVEYKKIEYGDPYYYENGEEFILTIKNDIINVGYSYIVEDSDDWAQAESYQVHWCKINEKDALVETIYDLIFNIKSNLRDSNIDDILSD
jgi:hypothetical protein